MENVMPAKKLIAFTMALGLLLGCQAGLSVQDQAATMVAETAAAAPPTDTAKPLATDTETPPTLTPSPAPTDTPAGPLVVKDDFSTKSDIWGKCDECEWKDGRLYFGPFPPNGEGINQVFSIACEACGNHTYFRIAADLTFTAGVAGDRSFGVGMAIPDQFFAGTGIAPSQYGALEAFDFGSTTWTGSDFKLYSAIKVGRGINKSLRISPGVL
jgi:hypothetical protein